MHPAEFPGVIPDEPKLFPGFHIPDLCKEFGMGQAKHHITDESVRHNATSKSKTCLVFPTRYAAGITFQNISVVGCGHEIPIKNEIKNIIDTHVGK